MYKSYCLPTFRYYATVSDDQNSIPVYQINSANVLDKISQESSGVWLVLSHHDNSEEFRIKKFLEKRWEEKTKKFFKGIEIYLYQ